MSRMNQVLEVNQEDFDCIVQPGLTWRDLNAYLRDTGLWFSVGKNSQYTPTKFPIAPFFSSFQFILFHSLSSHSLKFPNFSLDSLEFPNFSLYSLTLPNRSRSIGNVRWNGINRSIGNECCQVWYHETECP